MHYLASCVGTVVTYKQHKLSCKILVSHSDDYDDNCESWDVMACRLVDGYRG